MLFHSSTASRFKNIAQCFVSVLLCLTIFFNSITVAHAGTIGGWTYSNPISKGASAVISATKNVVINGKDFIKTGSATITPTAAQVAKTFGKTAGTLALTVAIEQILGTVDWVLDPENNRIIYYPPQEPSGLWSTDGVNYIYTSGTAASRAKCAGKGQTYRGYDHSRKYALCTRPNGTNDQWSLGYQYAPPAEREEEYLPFPTVAQKVISNAESRDTNAQAAILQAATDILAEAETDSTKARPITNQLEQSAETKPADAVDALKQNTGTAKTTNPDGSVAESEFEIPVACTWMPTICEAASVVTHQTKVWAQDIADYFKEEPQEQEDNTVDIDQSIPEINNKPRVSIGTDQCPSVPMNFDLGIVSIPIDLSPVWLCEIAQGVKPFFIALGFYFASNIVGRRQQ